MSEAEKQCKSKCSGQGSSTGFEEMMKKLSEMARKQARLNEQTQSLLPLQAQIPKEQLARLAAEQEAIRQALERMKEGLTRAQGLLRALEKAAKEAKEVSEELKRGRVNERLLKKQEKILARMLEVQRSIHKQEFSRRRKSSPGKPFKPEPPPELRTAWEREKLRRGLLELRNPLIPQEYRSLIKAYFQSLMRE
jgi:uncharacterized phage infection (PIP) family protein YhgE